MDNFNFKKLMFKTAFCCMACDGHIDQKEVEEMQIINKNSTYFGDVDLSSELDILLKDLKRSGKKVINELFQELRRSSLNPVQELLILEVTLRIIHADEKIDENEIQFLKLLRGRLELHDEVIIERFGKNLLLFNKEYKVDAHTTVEDFTKKMNLPDFEIIGDLKFEN